MPCESQKKINYLDSVYIVESSFLPVADCRLLFFPQDIDIKKVNGVPQYAFLQYCDIASVCKAIKKMDGEYLGNNRLKVKKPSHGLYPSPCYFCLWHQKIFCISLGYGSEIFFKRSDYSMMFSTTTRFGINQHFSWLSQQGGPDWADLETDILWLAEVLVLLEGSAGKLYHYWRWTEAVSPQSCQPVTFQKHSNCTRNKCCQTLYLFKHAELFSLIAIWFLSCLHLRETLILENPYRWLAFFK